ncbi:MAG TPA: hypothetical protein VFU15_13125 [Bacteroidia bacterium]|nr:hypothetical protein [Bacteroidia bacterium]
MLRILTLLSCAVFFLSCGNNPKKSESGSTKNDQFTDRFRKDVLTLRHVGLLNNIPDKTLDSLIPVYAKDTLNGLKDLLVYSGEAMKLDLRENGKAPHEVYDRLCNEIGKRYPELRVDSTRYHYLADYPEDHDTDWVLMRMKAGSDVFLQKLYWFRDWPIDETFCKVYNTMLAQQNKSYRMFMISYRCTNCVNPWDDENVKFDINTIGLIMLTKAQEDSLMPMWDLALDPEEEFSTMSPHQLDSMFTRLESSGLVTAKDKPWYDAKKEEIRENTIYGSEAFYDYIDTLFTTVSFDTINDYNPYAEMLKAMTHISRGHFNPGIVSDTTTDANFTDHTVRFSLNGKVYESEEMQRGTVLCTGLIDDVNKAMEEQKAGGAFYTVLTRDKIAIIVFIEDDKLEKVKSSGLFRDMQKGTPAYLRDLYNNQPELD